MPDTFECEECGFLWTRWDGTPFPSKTGKWHCPRCSARSSGRHPYHHGAEETCPRCSRAEPLRDDLHPEGF